jgi:hypothetical protein
MIRFRTVLSATAALVATSAHADEGMWTFDHFPSAKVKAAYGVDIDQAWLDHVQRSAVRLTGGCSASVVSRDGLVLTNNHCVAECDQSLSSPGHDLFKDGYAAGSRAEEKACPGQQAEILTAISDVTARITAAGANATGADLVKARNAVSSTLEKEGCPDTATTRCQVVNLYQGGQYKLYKYRKYSDVRLVFSPGFTAAFFGGDPDNFNFPRYDLDCAFIRLYENGKPVSTPDHLTWSTAAPRAGEPVFVAGNPGGTDRQLTISQIETQRDLSLPINLVEISELRGRLIRFGEESAESKRMAADALFGLENTYKVLFGRLFALDDKPFMDSLKAREADLRAKAGASAPWDTIAAAQAFARQLYLQRVMLDSGPPQSNLFYYARALVRAAEERTKLSADRLPPYADARLPLMEHQILDPQPVEKPLEQIEIEFWLSKARELLTADDPTTRLLLGKDNPQALSARLVEGSTLGDPAVRKALWDGGEPAIRASMDPMIQFALRIDPAARAVHKAYEEKVTGPTVKATEEIAKDRFAAYGDSLYPDATFTLRLSYGKIAGWNERGREIPPFTRFGGLYERATGQEPFNLDPRWVTAKDKLNPETIFDFSATIDIIGGNSGSPLINAKGQVIGAVFDGNIHSLGGDYGYDPVLNRGVAVSTVAIGEALDKVYGLHGLLTELTQP